MTPRLLALSLAACTFVLTACGASQARPDGGVAVCDPTQERFLPVTVQDAQGQPVSGATVTAKNLTTGQTITAQTNDQGGTGAIGSSIGSGTVRITAQKGTQTSNTGEANFTCGECGCSFEPESVALTLNP